MSREIVAEEWQFKCDEPSSSFPDDAGIYHAASVAGDLLRRTLKALDKVGGGGLFLVIEHGDEESLVLCSEFPIGCREDSVVHLVARDFDSQVKVA